jgi:hypothetical protein
MPTIIDSLIVTLGLDPKAMDQQAPASTKKLKDLQEQSKKTEGEVKTLGKTANESAGQFEGVAKAVGGFLALVGGTMAIRAFISDQIEMNAQLERSAKNLGMNVSTLSAWGNAVEEVGGSAAGLQGTMDMLSKSQTELQLTGQSALIPYFSALGVSLADAGGKARPLDDILLSLADRFSHMDRRTANNMGRMMGIDPDTMNLLLQGRKELELTIARQKEHNAVTEKQAEQAVKMQRAIVGLKQTFAALGRGLLEQATPALEWLVSILQRVGEWAQNNSEYLGDFAKVLGVVAIAVAAVSLAASPLALITVGVLLLAAAIALLWQDYQTWKNGGDSLIDWGKWKKDIDWALEQIEKLKAAIKSIPRFASEAKEKFDKNVPGGHAANTASDKTRDKINGWLKSKFSATNSGGNSGGGGNMSPKDIAAYFIKQGWSPAQAAGIAANLNAESGGNSKALGDSGRAYGLGQWHSDRQAAFRSKFGHNIQQSSLEEQLQFVQFELTKGNEQHAGNALRGAASAAQAGAIISKLYERPRDASGQASVRGSQATSIFAGIPGASSTVAAAGRSGASGGAGSMDASVTNHIGTIVVQTQATDAKGIATDMGRSMDYLFTSQANTGMF